LSGKAVLYKVTLFLITLPKYKTAFIIQALYTKHIFSVEVSGPFWMAGASPVLAKWWSSGTDAAITYIWISHLQSQLPGERRNLQVHSDRQALWTSKDKK